MLLCHTTMLLAQAATSALRIACDGDNAGAEITVNQKFAGECPLDVKVAAGQVEIRALKKIDSLRERTFTQSFRIGDDVVKRLEVTLGPVQLNAEGQRVETERRRAEAERQRLENERRAAEAERARKAEEQRKAAEAARAARIVEMKRLAPIQAEERRRDRQTWIAAAFAADGLKAGTGTAFRDCADCPELVWIPPGKTTTTPGDNDLRRWIGSIEFGAPFAVGKFEVTFDEWDRCVAERGCTYTPPSGKAEGLIFDTQWGRGRQPVINVSPNHAQQYITWLARKTSQPYRLLTLAESHYVRYAGATTPWPWGAQLAVGAANCVGCGSKWDGERPADVGSFPANAWGVHDMVGNIAEHVADCLGPTSRLNPGMALDTFERAIDISNAPKDGRALDACSSETGASLGEPAYGLAGGSWGSGPALVQYIGQNKVRAWAGFRIARDYVPKPVVVDPASLKPFRDCADCPEMVKLPAGRFEMGSPYDTSGVTPESEYPLRNVTVASFSIGKTEVTRGQYSAFITATKHASAEKCNLLTKAESGALATKLRDANWQSPGFAQTDEHPVVCVSKQDAQAFTKWLTETTGNRYRLPSEAEWEYAARAGGESRMMWRSVDGNTCQFANLADISFERALDVKLEAACNDQWVFTAPVGRFKANAWGLRDMAGNAWEWVEDCWHRNYDGAPATAIAWQDAACAPGLSILRGLGWQNSALTPPAATRRAATQMPGGHISFRVVRENAP
ncbi:MAG: formylglycine-generating enzyme family protein [Burkholderiales bacterium]|nr:SUMF1/EgtB/PvdO family nonheme iron enzyme [Betaproteobacteria bacterium]